MRNSLQRLVLLLVVVSAAVLSAQSVTPGTSRVSDFNRRKADPSYVTGYELRTNAEIEQYAIYKRPYLEATFPDGRGARMAAQYDAGQDAARLTAVSGSVSMNQLMLPIAFAEKGLTVVVFDMKLDPNIAPENGIAGYKLVSLRANGEKIWVVPQHLILWNGDSNAPVVKGQRRRHLLSGIRVQTGTAPIADTWRGGQSGYAFTTDPIFGTQRYGSDYTGPNQSNYFAPTNQWFRVLMAVDERREAEGEYPGIARVTIAFADAAVGRVVVWDRYPIDTPGGDSRVDALNIEMNSSDDARRNPATGEKDPRWLGVDASVYVGRVSVHRATTMATLGQAQMLALLAPPTE